jgi:hypothetical protein
MKHLEIAISQIGVEEIPRGSNWGKDVKKYLASVGINFPASWCMAFVYWCVLQSGSKSLFKTGGVLMQWNKSVSLRVLKPQVGDIFIMDYGKGLGHTGFIEKVEGENINTIEGNTNDTGSREGYEVCRRIRKISACKGFLRIK